MRLLQEAHSQNSGTREGRAVRNGPWCVLCAVPLSTQWPGDKVGGTIQGAVTIWKAKRAPALEPEVPQGSGRRVLQGQSLPLYGEEPKLSMERRLSSAKVWTADETAQARVREAEDWASKHKCASWACPSEGRVIL